MLKEPYFLKNEEWYTYDDESEKFVLTDSAPIEAVESYKQYLKDYEIASNGYMVENKEDDDEDVANLFGL